MAPKTPADRLGTAGNTLEIPRYDEYDDDQSSVNSTSPLQQHEGEESEDRHQHQHQHQQEEEDDDVHIKQKHDLTYETNYNLDNATDDAPPLLPTTKLPHHPPRKTTTSHSLTTKLTHAISATTSHHNKFLADCKITPQELIPLHDPKSLKYLYDLGGFDTLLALLGTSKRGLNDNDEQDQEFRRTVYGVNKLPQRQSKSFFQLCWEAMKDKVLIILSIAAVVSLALGLYETFGSGDHYDDEGKPLPKVEWVEGVAILVAVCIVVVVGAANDYQKERQFAKLNAKKEDRELIVIRNGEQKLISIYDLLAGDVINLQTGDVVPADSILFQGEVECDESALTGESATIRKVPVGEAMEIYKKNLPTTEDIGSHLVKFRDPYLISGSKILSGLGNAVVTAVGKNSIHGRTMLSLHVEAETTPMQERLNNLAEGISKYGFLAAIILFIVLFIRFCVDISPGGVFHDLSPTDKGKKFIDIIITAVTIVVVAIPEGLPLAVTLALAFATTRMAQNGNLVRVLRSCEIMGGATAVCSDKTGTLTENKMRVVRGFFGLNSSNQLLEFDDTAMNHQYEPTATEASKEITPEMKHSFITNITLNSTAFENSDYDEAKHKQAKQRPKKKSFIQHFLFGNSQQQQRQMDFEMGVDDEPFLGNKTESALLLLGKEIFHLFDNKSLEQIRREEVSKIVQVIPFESSRKWSGIVVKIENGFRVYIKGAAEIVFKNCGYEENTHGHLIRLDRVKRDEVLSKIDAYANDALRAIALGHRDYITDSWPPSELTDEKNKHEADPSALVNVGASTTEIDKQFVLDALVGIQDPLKPGVAHAVAQCKQAGVTVRMVTGDNLNTAKAISKECGILTPDDLSFEHAFMEGPQFRKLSPEERLRIVPELKVLARSSPEDKRILVDTLKKSGEVVAVTGDGTNDAPALKLADVGFSMGIAGTEVAREASDIILMTDDFADIVQAIKWGRTVATSIKKFIQFQLTVNITACVLTFVSAVASSQNQSVLTAVQLLWVNLIMDTLAALALATDKPDDSFLNQKPAGRTAPLISTSMWKMILGQSITQLTITFILHFAGKELFFPGQSHISNHQKKQLDAMTFNTFVWLQFWKLFVTRKLDEASDVTTIRGRFTWENLNFFQHLFRNWYFIIIAAIIGGFQVLIMFVGGAAFSVAKQTPGMWATALLCGFISIPMGLVIRLIPNIWVEKIFPTRAFKKLIYIVGFGWIKRHKKKDVEKGKDGDGSGGGNNNSTTVTPTTSTTVTEQRELDMDDFGLGDFRHYQESPDVERYRRNQINTSEHIDVNSLLLSQTQTKKSTLESLVRLKEPVIFISKLTDPYINLAIEDYIFDNMPKVDTNIASNSFNSHRLLFYTNSPCVVIGKNQNPWKEVNLPLLNSLGIPLIRRRSGGGTVVHDLGNTNYSFMTTKNEFDRFKFVHLITQYVNSNGGKCKIQVNQRGDIVTIIDGDEYKISGSAYKISRGKSYHHGTMLLNSDLTRLKRLLQRDAKTLGVVESKSSVDSVKSKVANLGISNNDFIEIVNHGFKQVYGGKQQESMVVQDSENKEFNEMMGLTDFVVGQCNDFSLIEINEENLELPQQVYSIADKLKSWSWKYGHTPPFTHTLNHEELTFSIKFFVEKGKIVNVEWNNKKGDPSLDRLMQNVKQNLISILYTGEEVKRSFAGSDIGDKIGTWLCQVIDYNELTSIVDPFSGSNHHSQSPSPPSPRMKKLFIFLVLITNCFAATLSPTKPSQDDFYNAPSNFESKPVGTILKWRNVPNPLTSIFTKVNVQNAWQLLVRSEDTFGNPNAIVTTVIQPYNADNKKLVSYQTFEDSAKLDCSPSYAIQYGSDITTILTQFEMYYISALLDQGYYVVTPDYEGPKSAFTVGVQAGRATLNSLRAALNSHNITGLDPNAKSVMWGYSGGSIASGWAAVLQPQYAPDLSDTLLGAALGGLVTNISATAHAIDGGPFAGIIGAAFGGLSNEYTMLAPMVLEEVDPSLSEAYFNNVNYCLIDSVIAYFGDNFFGDDPKYFPNGWTLLETEPGKSVLEANGLVYNSNELVPSIPLFIYHGLLDGIIPIEDSKKTFDQWCKAGLKSGEFSEDISNGHITEAVVGAPAALTWITKRLNGEAPVSGCVYESRLSNFLYPDILPSVSDIFSSALRAISGLGLGEGLSSDDISLMDLLKISVSNMFS
ncbi:PMC1 [Candida oxycetoniae]|uniref:Calcium-transporting ATPase n=1 Tax=Candida oxycetoniae TaxID=497107 RepID=A0AAI9WX49_9ASCO|nr:PMC1 [Candida oxycetoniae]KAI3403946.2 PMC1 [Candida oxycetoniae]